MILYQFQTKDISICEQRLIFKVQKNLSAPKPAPGIADNPEVKSLPSIANNRIEEAKNKSERIVDAREDHAAAKSEAVDRTAEQLHQMKIGAETWKKMTPEQQAQAIQTLEKTPATRAIHSFTDTIKHTAADIRTDFVKGGPWTKAGYIAGGVVGFLAARWLWRKAFGDGANEGFMKKSGKWLLSLGAGVAGVLGVKALVDKFKKNPMSNSDKSFFDQESDNPLIPNSIEPTVEGGYEGASKGVEEGMKIFGTAATEILNHENVTKVLNEKEKYTNNVAFTGALISALMKDGYDLVIDEIGVGIYAGGKLLPLTGTFYTQAWDYFMNENMTPDATGNLFATYVEGTLIYATSLSALKLATINRAGKGANIIVESLLWPIYTVKRTGQGTFQILRATTELASSESATRLTLKRMDAALSRNMRLRTGRLLTANSEGLMLRYDFAQAQKILFDKAKINIKDDNALKLFEKNKDLAIDEFGDYLKGMKESDIPQEFMEAYKKTTKANILKLNREQLNDILKKMGDKNSAASTVIEIGEEAPAVASKPKIFNPDDADIKTAKNTVRVAQATEVVDAVSEAKNIENARALLKTDDMQKVLKAANMTEDSALQIIVKNLGNDVQALDNISLSKRGRALLQGAMLSNNTAEISRILNAAKSAGPLMRTLNVIGAGGDIFGAYMAYCDYQEYGASANNTTNMALKDMYAKAQTFSAIEGAASAAGATGFVIQGICIMKAGGTISAALSAPAGAVLLPIGIAAAVGRETHKALMESTAYHLLDEKEMMEKLSPGKILEHIGKTDLLFQENLNWSQGLFLNDEQRLEGNEGARSEGYRAYFTKTAIETIPLPTPLECGTEALIALQKNDNATLQSEVEKLHKNLIGKYVGDAMSYIKKETGGTYVLNTKILADAALYAQVRTEKSRNNIPLGNFDKLDKAYDKNRSERLQITDAADKIASLTHSSERDIKEMGLIMLELVRHDLATAEQKILTAEFTGVRGYIAEEVSNEIRRSLFTKTTVTPTDVSNLRGRLQKIIESEPHVIAEKIAASPNLERYEKQGANPLRLTVAGILDIINT